MSTNETNFLQIKQKDGMHSEMIEAGRALGAEAQRCQSAGSLKAAILAWLVKWRTYCPEEASQASNVRYWKRKDKPGTELDEESETDSSDTD